MSYTSEDMNRAMEEGREEGFERIEELEAENKRLREALSGSERDVVALQEERDRVRTLLEKCERHARQMWGWTRAALEE